MGRANPLESDSALTTHPGDVDMRFCENVFFSRMILIINGKNMPFITEIMS